MSEDLGIKTKKSVDFGKWFLEVMDKAEIVDIRYGVKGLQIFLPLATLTIREIINRFEEELEQTGHKPITFPTLIPESSLLKEKEHIKGFEEEVFWITHAGKRELEEKLCLRPTSETAFYPMYSIWIRSHLQLPLKFYQISRIFRYETKMTKPLLRSREFIFIESHTAQKTFKEAEDQVAEDMKIFDTVVKEGLGIQFLLFKRPQWDKFPGAEDSYAFETIMPDGKILQVGTTHNLGQKFAKVFDINFMDKDKKKKYVYQTCFGPGISRIVGGLFAIHGDDKGLIIPPAVAPLQIVIIPVFTKETKTEVMKEAGELLGRIVELGYRVYLDDREQHTPGFKFHEWELKGVPLRIEIGPKDIEENKFSLVRRDFLERMTVDQDKLEQQIMETLESIGFQLQKRATELMTVKDAENYTELKEILKEGGFVRIPFCMNEKCANKLKTDTTAEVRGTLFGEHEKAKGKCAICGKPGKEMVYVARAY